MEGDLELVMATEEGRDLMHHFRRSTGTPFASPPAESGPNSVPGDCSGVEKQRWLRRSCSQKQFVMVRRFMVLLIHLDTSGEMELSCPDFLTSSAMESETDLLNSFAMIWDRVNRQKRAAFGMIHNSEELGSENFAVSLLIYANRDYL
ncbi:hypothetical protein llap_8237 [Limosa lapponica baueri]|uniref:Uncharacterized protein n=1 Tax=Limosa lapponica baueri TaxID=1758121 RepID=A0A2I0U5T9_LIMLA|nr:hypothetical protein llap_8237 [Limosa lapponica baueri]